MAGFSCGWPDDHVEQHLSQLACRHLEHIYTIIIRESFDQVCICNNRTKLLTPDTAGTDQHDIHAETFRKNICKQVSKLCFLRPLRMCQFTAETANNEIIFLVDLLCETLQYMLYMVRDEAFLGHTEFYQIPSKFRFCYNRERGEFDSFTYCGKELGREISDDTVFTVGMQNFHFQNVEKFLSISYETISQLQKPRCIASSCQDILMEYFREHEWLDSAVDGRMTM